jgi:hypothetical protein
MPLSQTEPLDASPVDLGTSGSCNATTIHARIAEGMASAQAGRVVDGEAVFARIRAKLNGRERSQRD